MEKYTKEEIKTIKWKLGTVESAHLNDVQNLLILNRKVVEFSNNNKNCSGEVVVQYSTLFSIPYKKIKINCESIHEINS